LTDSKRAYPIELASRREALGLLAGGLIAAGIRLARAEAPPVIPRARIILDNDFAGDPDGLFQTAHHLLSPSVDVRFIVGSHLHRGETWGPSQELSAAASAAKARELLDVMDLAGHMPVVAGASAALENTHGVGHSAAADAIIQEALRDDTELPLYYAAGAGLTDIATAWLLEPRIARRVTLVWIGGPEYPGTPRPPGRREAEYNLTIDTLAAQEVFNRSYLPLWQVPRSTYRQMLVGCRELQQRVRPLGKLGGYLVDNVERVMRLVAELPLARRMNLGETYILGDSPLVTLTALQSPFQPDPSSSQWVAHRRPTIDAAGEYGSARAGQPIRVYTHIDARLTFEDLYAKLEDSAARRPEAKTAP
jgi:hypothetical protein